ncbi:leucine rich repeat containing 75Bb isoform X4 [Alosa sapidissima]|uniref:leucine rich repeat containing 75Bb isoform X3 n=1 Tax=Alosa sapidissima TaxID=34773 RepID=UPI001C081EEA|nr:leucine rich repeat containing 75Bb isoform X3 [Alosa sapidissima]XP_041914297.1 leucine rich repeat containing 75Bb isoform X4 [Alosa sapidissima]
MGSKLTRQRSLDSQASFFRKGRQRNYSSGDAERSDSRGGGDFLFTSLMLKSEKLPGMLRRNSNSSPYVRRVAWVREIQRLLREQKVDQAADVLKLLRKDLGLEGTSLNDILYKNAAFLNLVDPISHELLLSLARDMQCPKREADALKSSDKICRQLIYHLTPHSKWTRQSVSKRKSQACLKTTLKKKISNDIVDLSGIPLSGRDVQRVALYLQDCIAPVTAVDLSFTELQDESLRLLLPSLSALPKLTTIAVNGNRLTTAVLKDLMEALKERRQFPKLAWIDLGNNLDIFTLPQPLLVSLRRRFGTRSSLPTIHEFADDDEGSAGHYRLEMSTEEPSVFEEDEEEEEEVVEEERGVVEQREVEMEVQIQVELRLVDVSEVQMTPTREVEMRQVEEKQVDVRQVQGGREVLIEAPIREVLEAPVREVLMEAPIREVLMEAPIREVLEAPIREVLMEAPIREVLMEAPIREVLEAPIREVLMEAPMREVEMRQVKEKHLVVRQMEVTQLEVRRVEERQVEERHLDVRQMDVGQMVEVRQLEDRQEKMREVQMETPERQVEVRQEEVRQIREVEMEALERHVGVRQLDLRQMEVRQLELQKVQVQDRQQEVRQQEVQLDDKL